MVTLIVTLFQYQPLFRKLFDPFGVSSRTLSKGGETMIEEMDLYTLAGLEQLEEDEDYPAQYIAFMRGYLES